MTKYVLNSGGVHANKAKAIKFFAEIVKDLGPNPRILFCFFATPRENWEEKFQEYQIGFPDRMPAGVQPNMELAMPSKFVDQVKTADVIYVHGGDDHLLQYWLSKFDIPKIWDDKVVGASSAGSDALASSFWTCDWRECMDGLGVVPIKFFSHYRSTSYAANDPRGPIDWEKAHKELKNYGGKSLPIHALEEGEFIVINA